MGLLLHLMIFFFIFSHTHTQTIKQRNLKVIKKTNIAITCKLTRFLPFCYQEKQILQNLNQLSTHSNNFKIKMKLLMSEKFQRKQQI